MKNTTNQMARFIVNFALNDLPAEVVEQLKVEVMDTLASSIACFEPREHVPAVKLADYVRELGGKDQATLIGFGDLIPASNVVFANTSLAAGSHFDAIHDKTNTHALSMVIPTALAAAEMKSRNGNKVMEAIIVGLETMVRAGLSVGGGRSIYSRGIHPTSVCGVLGSAAAAAKVLGLDEQETVQALGLAATRGFGLLKFHDNQSAFFQMGKAAQSGFDAASLVQRGFDGPSGIFEDEPIGFCRIFSNTPDFSKLTDGLGKTFAATEITLKPYAVERFFLSVIEASMQLARERQISPEEIDKMTIRLGIPIYAPEGVPRDLYQAQKNGPYLVATSLILGQAMKFSLRPFLRKTRKDPKIVRLMRRMKIVAEPELSKSFAHQEYTDPHCPCILEVKTKDGRLQVLNRFEPEEGSPKNPMTADQVKVKFEQLAEPIIGRPKVEKAIELMMHLETLEEIHSLLDQFHSGELERSNP